MKAGELFFRLGFDVDGSGLQVFDAGVKNLTRNLTLQAGALAGIMYGLNKFIDTTVQGALGIDNLARTTGAARRELEQWGVAANLANPLMQVQDMQASISALSKNLKDLKWGQGGNAGAFNLLGVHPDPNNPENPLYILRQLPEAFKNTSLSVTDFVSNMEAIGINRGFLNLIQDPAFRDIMLQARGMTNTQGQTDQIEKAAQALARLHNQIGKTKDAFVADNSGSIEDVALWLDDFAKRTGSALNLLKELNQEFANFKTAAITIGAAVGLTFAPLVTVVGGLVYLLDQIAKWKNGQENFFASPREILNMISDVIKKPFVPREGEESSDFQKYMQDLKAKDEERQRSFNETYSPQPTQQVTNNNIGGAVFNIDTTADGRQVATDVATGLQRFYDKSGVELNNGASY